MNKQVTKARITRAVSIEMCRNCAVAIQSAVDARDMLWMHGTCCSAASQYTVKTFGLLQSYFGHLSCIPVVI